MVIFLNGPSSAGKSTVAQAIMRQSAVPYLWYSVDSLVNQWIDKKFVTVDTQCNAQWQQDWFYYKTAQDSQDCSVVTICDGPQAKALHQAMIESIGLLARKNIPLIIDESLWYKGAFSLYVKELIGLKSPVYLINVICALEEAERREKKLNNPNENRYIGLARGSIKQVEDAIPAYDLKVDTTNISGEAAAQKILNFIGDVPSPQNFHAGLSSLVHFEPFKESHLPLLLKWLEAPHVKGWWDKDAVWTPELIREKYSSYADGYKMINNEKKPISAYIAYFGEKEVGYIQCYNAHDFPRDASYALNELPKSLAALDLFIGDEAFIGKGLGPRIMEKFLTQFVDPFYDACVVDPDIKNGRAIRTYEKIGFKKIKIIQHGTVVLMLRESRHS